VLGVLYFLKYAFDNQWIGNTGRVLIGGFAGLALLYGGERFQAKGYKLYGQTLAGGGIVVLYLSIYAAFNFYSLIGQLPAMLLMALVTAVCCTLAYRYSSVTLATMGLIGGLLTPYWLSTGKSNEIGLLTYLLILDVGAAWLARQRRWAFLNLISFAGTVILFLGWAETFYRAEDVWTTEFFLVLFAGLYLALTFDWAAHRENPVDGWLAWLFGSIVTVLFFVSNVVLFFDEAGRFWPFIVLFVALGLVSSLRLRAGGLALAVFLLALVGVLPWLADGYHSADRPLVVASLTAFWLLFLLVDVVRVRGRLGEPGYSSLALNFLNGTVYFGLLYFLLFRDYADWMGLLAIGVALVHLAGARLFLVLPASRSLVLIHIGVSVTLATLAIPIQLEQDWVTIGWGVEALVLTWIGTVTASLRMRQAGLAVLGLCLIRLFGWTALRPIPDYVLILNRRFLAFLAIVAVVGLIALLYARARSSSPSEAQLAPSLVLLASALFVIGSSQEAWTYYDHQLAELNLAFAREELDQAGFDGRRESLMNSQQLTLSLVWGLCSILSVVAGLMRRFRPIRLFGIGLFVVAIIKVFFVDIWLLEQLYRIISTIALGGLLLGVAFLYQRFKALLISA